MHTHIYVAHAHVRMQLAILSCAYADVRMSVAMRYRSQPARKYCFNDVRVRVWLGLGLGVEAMFDGVRVAKEARRLGSITHGNTHAHIHICA